jgi:hypothetical protein
METEANLRKVLEMSYFSVPKERYPALSQSLVSGAMERADHWLIPCTHTRHDPAMKTDLEILASKLGQVVPAPLQNLLGATNGADLFRLHYRPTGFDDYWIPRYRLFSCARLIEVYQQLLGVFLAYAELDDEYRDTQQLNYLAFCDVGDGNYLAVRLEGVDVGSVFFLDHEYGFYPYRSELATGDAYAHVAGSIDEWLVQLVQTGGWEGLGGRFIPL